MKVSLFAPLVIPVNDAAYVSALAKGAEARGFHSIWLGEHVVLFDNYDAEYPYEENGKIRSAATGGSWSRSQRFLYGGANIAYTARHRDLSRPAAQSRLYGERNCCGRLSVTRARRLGWVSDGSKRLHRVGCALCPSRCPVPRVSGGDQVSWTDDVSSYSGDSINLNHAASIRNRSNSRDHPYISGVRVMRLCAGSPISVPVGTDSMLRREMFRETC